MSFSVILHYCYNPTLPLKGTILKSTGNLYRVLDLQGQSWECRLRGKFKIGGSRSTNPLAVGDNVEFEPESNKKTGVITAIDERRNHIVRRSTNLSHRTQVDRKSVV